MMQQVERERMTAEDVADVGCSCGGLVVAGSAVGLQIDQSVQDSDTGKCSREGAQQVPG